jgi:hypothetical protein
MTPAKHISERERTNEKWLHEFMHKGDDTWRISSKGDIIASRECLVSAAL